MDSGVSKTVHIDQPEYHFGTFLYPLGVNQYSVLPSSYIRSRIYFFQHGVGGARKSTAIASGSNIVGESRGEMENPLVTQDSTHRGFC